MSFYPSVLQEISVLFELILGHLCYRLTDVPPQPNSPPDNVMVERRPAHEAPGLSLELTACEPPFAIKQLSQTTSGVVVFHRRIAAPTYATPPKSSHNVRLESSSTGSSFPAD